MKEDLYYLKYEEERIIALAEEIFGKQIIENIYKKLDDIKKNKFLKIVFFYYWRCYKIRKENTKFDEGSMLIVITSAIEYLVSGGLLKNLGSAGKFKVFWKNYINDEDKEEIEDSSWCVYLNNDRKTIERKEQLSLEEISHLLYKFRCEFVHKANYVPIANPSNDDPNENFLGSGFSRDNGLKHYFIGATMDRFALLFEKGFIKYFEKFIK